MAQNDRDDSPAQLVPRPAMFQVLDTETGSIEVLEAGGAECAWPAPRASSALAVWRDRFLVAYGGLVRAPMLSYTRSPRPLHLQSARPAGVATRAILCNLTRLQPAALRHSPCPGCRD